MRFPKVKSRPVRQDRNGSDSSNDELTDMLTQYNTTMSALQSEVLEHITPKKLASEILAEIYKIMELETRANRVSNCGSFLEYRVTKDDKKLALANFCKDRLCPLCNWRRSLKIFGQISAIMDVLEHENLRFLFLTLTVKNCTEEELERTVQMLFDGWRYLYHKNRVFRNTILGTFRTLEITRNKKTGQFHPHLHVILAVRSSYFKKEYISQAIWSDMWRSACDLSYNPIIDIRTVKNDSRGISGAVAEASKYSVKSTDFLNGSTNDCIDYIRSFLDALSGRRLCSFTGIFAKVRKQLNLDDIENGDLVHVDPDAIRDDLAYMIVRYQWKSGAYVAL